MKRIKKLASLLLAMVMVLAMGTTVFAGGEVTDPQEPNATSYSITIENATPGHVYEAYQIFAGDLYEEPQEDGSVKKTLSNIVWGAGVSADGQTVMGDAAEKAETITDSNVAQFAQDISVYLTTPSGSTNTITDNNTYVISNLPAGYYLVKDADGSLLGDDNYTTFILEVVSNATAVPKNSGTPESDKQVKDKNDSENTETEWQDSADYDIGDHVPYLLTAKLPDTITAYDTYKLVFHDKLSAGLTYDGDDTVKVSVKNGESTTVITEGYTIASAEGELTVTFANVKAAPVNATNKSEIYVEYTATLNERANIGAEGNINTLTLEYSNNPNSTGNGDNEPTGTTPPTTAIVFTFETVVNKVDETKNPLAGAAFKLEKLVKNDAGEENWVEVRAYEAGADTSFSFSGLDDGKYKLTETVTPDGYNSIDPIYFMITATHVEKEDKSGDELKELNVVATDDKWTPLTGENVTKFEVTVSTGTGTTNIVNQSGTVLPSTGGIGTTIFYVIGGILVVAAGVLLVTKKRMKAE